MRPVDGGVNGAGVGGDGRRSSSPLRCSLPLKPEELGDAGVVGPVHTNVGGAAHDEAALGLGVDGLGVDGLASIEGMVMDVSGGHSLAGDGIGVDGAIGLPLHSMDLPLDPLGLGGGGIGVDAGGVDGIRRSSSFGLNSIGGMGVEVGVEEVGGDSFGLDDIGGLDFVA